MFDLPERVAMLESQLGSVYIGEYYGGDGDGKFPYQAAIRIRFQRLQASLFSAIHLAAQAKLGQHDEGSDRLISEIIEEWCGTRVPGRPPRPHWGSIVEQLAILSDGYAPGTALHDASLELCARVVSHVREQSKATR